MTPRGNAWVNQGLWLIIIYKIMYVCSSIVTNITSLCGVFYNGGGYACVWQEYTGSLCSFLSVLLYT